MNQKPGFYKVRDLSMAKEGSRLIEWAESRMPVLMALQEKYHKSKPFKGYKIAGCLHVTKETAVLVKTFVAAGPKSAGAAATPSPPTMRSRPRSQRRKSPSSRGMA